MPLVKNATSTLAQGVSQQAESQRYPSQATEQVNAYSSPIKGLVKRPPTKFISQIDADTGGSAFVHTINRDAEEQYVLVVNPDTQILINSINYSTNKVNVPTVLSVNDAIRFSNAGDGTLPIGLEAGVTYYVLSATAVTSTWDITVSHTKGGSIVNIGKAEIDSVRITAVKDKETGQWVDGVFLVTFAANHGFERGDKVRIQGLNSPADTLIFATTEYELRVPDNYDYHYTYANSAYSVATWSPNQFVLGIVGASTAGVGDNLGYLVDTRWEAAGAADGYTMLGDGASGTQHFVLLDGAGNRTHTKGNKLHWDWSDGGNEDFPSGWDGEKLLGATIRLGTVVETGKAYRATITAKDDTARTLTLDHYVDLNDELFDAPVYDEDGDLITTYSTSSNPKWVFISYWSDTTSSVYSAGSNPRQFIDTTTPPQTSASYVGADDQAGFLRVNKGGIQIYDAKTGTEKALKIDSGIDYLTDGNDPLQNLKAVTIADHTFLVNTQQTVRAKGNVRYSKRFEAFITARTADYGKKYGVKVGSAASPRTTDATGLDDGIPTGTLTSDEAYVDIAGYDENMEGDKWIFRIKAKGDDPKFNNWQIRIIQNWRWRGPKGTNPMNSTYSSPATHKGKLEGEAGRVHFDLLPAPIGTDYWTTKNYSVAADSKVAVAMDSGISVGAINIYVNFPWAQGGEETWVINQQSNAVQQNQTTVADIIAIFEQTNFLKDEWEIVPLTGTAAYTESAGVQTPTAAVEATSTADVATAKTYRPQYTIVGARMDDQPVTAANGVTYFHGREESIQHLIVAGTVGELTTTLDITEGFLTPSAKDTHIKRKFWTSKGGRSDDGTSWDGTAETLMTMVQEVGEYWYKTPKWTGEPNQTATGTERIAEMLASSVKIVLGKWVNWETAKKANGRALTYTPDGFKGDEGWASREAGKGKEEAFGMTYTSGSQGYLFDSKASGDNRRLKYNDDEDRPESNWTVQQQGYTIALRAPGGEKFQISVEDDLGGQGLKLTYFEVSESADLPNICRQGHIVKVVGDAREEADDYYLRFEADDPTEMSVLQEGRWVECLGYDQTYMIDNSTMPLSLARSFDESGNAKFTLREVEWVTRQSGDDRSNPFPSFVGHTLNDIFLFRNRLGFLSGENVILSEAGEYFNFFRSTVAALLDAAPIDVTASTNKVSTLRSAIPLSERLILFSDQTQFTLDAEPYLTVKTVTISPSNEIVTTPTCKPVVAGNSLFFGFERGEFGGVGELATSRQDSDLLDAGDISSHVPKYIRQKIKKMAAAANEDVLCAITERTDKAVLYVYKFFENPTDGQRVQSAWFQYEFGSADDYILDIDFIGNKLYMVMKRGTATFIETLTFEDNTKDTNMDYEVCLDFRLDKPSSGVSYTGDETTGTTTVTLPTGYLVTADMKLVSEDSVQYSSSTAVGASTFTVPKNLSSKGFFIGVPYTMEYTLSQPFLKSEKVTETGRYQLQRAYLEYANARSFTVDVTHNPKMVAPNKQTVTNTFATDALQQELISGTAELQTGFFPFAIQERNDKVQLVIKNDTPYPSDFLSIDYEARAFSRGSRWRG